MPTSRAMAGQDTGDSSLAQLLTGQFGSGSSVGVHQQLPFIIVCNTDSVGHTLTTGSRSTGLSVVKIPVAASSALTIPTAPFNVLTIDTSGTPSACYWFYSDVPLSGPSLAAGSSGNYSVNGFLTVESGSAPTVGTPLIKWSTSAYQALQDGGGGTLRVNPSGGATTIGSALGFIVTGGGIVNTYNGIATVGGGIPAEYASTTTSPVTLTATSSPGTTITTYTPTAAGLFMVVVTITPQTAFSKTGGVTVGYTDGTLGAAALQTQTIASTASAVPQSFFFLCNATTATAITVAGFISTASDAVGSAAIFAL